jgi:glycosyltransferase involved in cell wall biosynthesis
MGPDHFVYETESMRRTGVLGRGIPNSRTSVVPLGVDTDLFQPNHADREYAYREFGIPGHRHLLFYSGHFEQRKGVRVIIDAMLHLVDRQRRDNVHAILCGNQLGEEQPFLEQLAGSDAATYVTFAGYRNDIPKLHRSCAMGVIASTGWDSMTMSSIEMQASGLPLLVSNLQGLPETIEDEITGRTFPPGDAIALASHIEFLIDQPATRLAMATAARSRAVQRFSQSVQMSNMTDVLRGVITSDQLR